MRNIINYTIGKDTLIIGERGEQNANDIVFNGFSPLSDNNTIFFVLDELTYPLMNNTVTVTFPMTAHSGLFVGQLVEKNAEGFVVNKSPVFKVKVTASVEAIIEVTDPRFESLFEEYTRLYNEMLSLESEVNEMKADVIESFEQIKAEFERIKTELAQDYADTKSNLIETVRTAIEEADGQIARAKDNALNDVNQAKGNALSDIAQAKDNGINEINQAKGDALDGINQAKDDGINEIETAKTNAVADGIKQIETAKADIEQKKTEAIADVITAKTDGINGIEQKKTEAIADIDEVVQPFVAEYGSIPSEVSKLSDSITNMQSALAENKRVDDARWKMSQGIVWDFAEDDAEAYSKDIPTGARLMDVQSIGGKSVCWNQLCKMDNKSDTSNTHNVAWINNYDGSVMATGIPNVNVVWGSNGPGREIALYANHIYYMRGCPSGGSSQTYHLTLWDSTTYLAYDYGNGVIYRETTNRNTANVRARIIGGYDTGSGLVFKPNLFDLTAMFGAGNEPTSVDDPRIAWIEQHASTHHEYNAGEIISADVNEVVVRGKNLLNQSHQTAASKGYLRLNADGSYTDIVGGLPETFRVYLPNGTYTVSIVALQGVFNGHYVRVNDTANNTTTQTFTVTNGESALIKVRCYGTGVVMGIQIEKGTTATAYTPYIEPYRIPIPEAIRNLDGYGWGVGTARNEVECEQKKYDKRVSSLDLGELNWTREESVHLWYSSHTKANDDGIAGKPLLTTFSGMQTYIYGKDSIGTSINAKSNIWVNNGSSTEKPTGIAYYELAEPIVTDISDLLDDRFESIEVEPNGSITFEQADTELPIPNKEEYLIALKEVG